MTPSAAPATNWSAYSMEQIWNMVRFEDGEISWRQHDAWRRMALVCRDQADQLDRAVRQLIERWPPYPGSASEVFGKWMAGLTASMHASADAAERAKTVIDQITRTLGVTQSEIAGIVRQYNRYAEAEYALLPKPTPSPGEAPPPPAPAGTTPPPPGWREALTQQARDVIEAADKSVGKYADTLVKFPKEPPKEGPDKPGSGPVQGTGTGTFALPGIPISSAPVSGLNIAHMPEVGRGDPYPDVDRIAPDPVLAGGTVIPSPPSLPGPGTPPPIPGAAPGFGAPPPGVIVPVSMRPGARIEAGGVAPSQPAAHRGGASTHAAATPTGAGVPTGRAPATHAPGMVPMAPMIPPGSARPGSTAAVAPGGRAASPGRRRGATDPDDPWAVRQGSPAVIEPAAEPEDFDPGPGVIGLNR